MSRHANVTIRLIACSSAVKSELNKRNSGRHITYIPKRGHIFAAETNTHRYDNENSDTCRSIGNVPLRNEHNEFRHTESSRRQDEKASGNNDLQPVQGYAFRTWGDCTRPVFQRHHGNGGRLRERRTAHPRPGHRRDNGCEHRHHDDGLDHLHLRFQGGCQRHSGAYDGTGLPAQPFQEGQVAQHQRVRHRLQSPFPRSFPDEELNAGPEPVLLFL